MNKLFVLSAVKAGIMSALFSLLFVIMLPVSFSEEEAATDLTIVATGEHNPDAKSAEVWIRATDSERLEAKIVRKDPGWETKYNSLVSFRNQPAVMQSALALKSDKFLRFATSEYSGIVEVKYGQVGHRIDLYSPNQGMIEVDLRKIAPMQLSLWANAISAAKPFGIAFVAFFILLLVLGRRAVSPASRASSGSAWMHAWIVLSSLTVYGLVLAAYWPGQMSPDSINQWGQIVSGQYNDSHPILSTQLYKLAFDVYPQPQSAVILQILIFTSATWFFFKECLAWGASPRVIALAALLFPLFPATFLIVTTLWKDVPFTAGVILLSALAAREVRRGMTLRLDSLFLMGMAGVLIIAMRHNGILISVIFFAALLFFAKAGQTRLRVGVTLISQIAIFLMIKTLLLTVLNVSPILPQYRAIVAMHVLGSMETAGVEWESDDRQLLERLLPAQEWRENYKCESVVPLFWHPELRKEWSFLGEHTSELNSLALKAIWNYPLVFLKHQTCVTGLIWRIGGRDDEWLSISPAEITSMPEQRELGLQSHSLLPALKSRIDELNQNFVQRSTVYTRPALYTLIGLISMCIIAIRSQPAVWLLFAPLLCNLMSLTLLMGAQDYRYLWPSVVMSLLVFFMALGLSFGRNGTAEKNELLNAHVS
ncbi:MULTISPECIES: hypothetical protein [unclassified Pseudomonas]|jgi:hypothetical protein|uniref:hypothetical protein n=1 Tax=unclassified Pseudomonas TaxID=196821 RepID=UPI000C876AFD|nr:MULTISPECIES: hypothetical protein [unclassified Pseudomonas]PMU10508.1 hypothetical protein C1Y11_11550 [Pseudomonas sp. FW305-20]PMU21154.1 hypothetical protein C1Y10_04215 [Pseudomonas sp. FW305-122]PMU41157.1 hypothetical protein C1Y12_08540 [Pseudomonas sp. FW305-47B]PMX64099.1 hypothetical protein C1Y13_04900 [Pseudomonas sp. FW305-33]PMX70785.1 hypothetical protein C1X12_03740 [Pseudomonas sp. FW305-60]